MSEQKSIFVDSSGKRATFVKVVVTVILLCLSIAVSLFLVSILGTSVTKKQLHSKRISRAIVPTDRSKADLVLSSVKKDLAKHLITNYDLTNEPKPSNKVVLGFYAPWEEGGLDSLRAHAKSLSHLSPVWFRISDDGQRVETTDFDLASNPNNSEVLEICRKNGIKLIPLLSNANEGNFKGQKLRPLLTQPQLQVKMVNELLQICKLNGFQGINIDFEEISDEDYAACTKFFQLAHSMFKGAGLELSIDVQASIPGKTLKEWADASDYLVLMAYDEHDENGDEGPIASIKWFESVLDQGLQEVPEEKMVLGIGNYAYDWRAGRKGAESITFQEAMALASGYRDSEPPQNVVNFDPVSFNSTFEYEDEDKQLHRVWILDGPSAFNQWQVAKDRGLRGAAVWTLGAEDPSIWKFIHKNRLEQKSMPPDQLEKVIFPFQVNYTGKGEVLKVVSEPKDGARTISVDKQTGLIDDVEYESFPTAYLIRKSGYSPNKLVLTFDDGPDPRYTPKILDVLKEQKVPGAFFWVGGNIEQHPGIAQRTYEEGHEIGNHSFTHPNLGTAADTRVNLEINATQRAIESAVGRSSLLFRPPYNADSQPRTKDEVKPVAMADKLGYLTIGENVDPNDWNPTIVDSNGGQRARTAEDIARLTIEDIENRKKTGEEGNIILLHDAGGERDKTIDALRIMIPELKRKGYQFVTISELLGKKREDLMPQIPASERQLVDADKVVFNFARVSQWLLSTGFILAILLGVGRIFYIVPLALLQRKRSSARVFNPEFQPPVTVMIAAYNEEKTIAATILSVLKSKYPISEVIIVDDGSKDSTSQVVRDLKHPLVKLITKENGGKASALNHGLEAATNEFLFCIDADTQLDPDAIGKLIRHFEDEKVGAVAGNVQVGNVNGVLTAWQAVEYRTSQNLDRRAYSLLNCITVVPGAIGMWRKSAVMEAGAYTTDTMAEDMDLTWRIRQNDYKLVTEPEAIAYTEAPETWRALSKQRFRWAYGTFQCLWKHRRAMGKFGWFGWFALPTLWVFQVGFQLLGPFVDLQILFSAILFAVSALGSLATGKVPDSTLVQNSSKEITSTASYDALMLMVELYALFFIIELVAGFIAYRLDKEKPWPLAWLVVQRFAYRQLMYLVMLKSVWVAILGAQQGWGKLKRTGSVKMK